MSDEPKRYIRIELQEFRKHMSHEVKLDHGSANFGGEQQKHEYYVWCQKCGESIGTSITVKSE